MAAPSGSLPNDRFHTPGKREQCNDRDSQTSLQDEEVGSSSPPDGQIAFLRERKRQAKKRARTTKRQKRNPNTSVYVTGVPKDATTAEIAAHFAKCGILMPSSESGMPRIKLYEDDDGKLKGDALVTYALEPSVENAILILDGVPLRAGEEGMKVERAKFENDGNNNRKIRKEPPAKSRFKSRDLVAEALSWAEDGQEQKKTGRIVILKNVFDASEDDYEGVKEDIMEGCSPNGTVEMVTVFERSIEGAVAVKFATLEACVKCIQVMNGRWYDGRKISAEFYDGVTDYRYKETQKDRAERDKKWQEWLDREESHTNEMEKPGNDTQLG